MADTKTSALPVLTAPAIDDYIIVYDASTATLKRIAHADLCVSGTFTPAIAGSTVAGVQTYSTQTGNYSRIGNIVVFNISLTLSAKDGATSGNLLVTGMPAACDGFTAVSVAFQSNWSLTASHHIDALITDAGTTIELQETDGATKAALTEADFSGNETIMIAGSYIAA